MPDEAFQKAKALFAGKPEYAMLDPVLPQPQSLVHTYPLFKLKGAAFMFLLMLMSASERYVECDPAVCERSHGA